MQRRITLTLEHSELQELQTMAGQEYRTPRDQAKYLLIKALTARHNTQTALINAKSDAIRQDSTVAFCA